MKQPRICATITEVNTERIKQVEPLVDLYEVRIDLIDGDWQKVVKQLGKPWIACNRTASEGGQWQANEARRIEALLHALELGASIIDIELRTKNLPNIIKLVKRRAECLLSHHDFAKTPDFDTMKKVVQEQIEAGADICKVVPTARSFRDNLSVLELIAAFPHNRVVSFAMGTEGITSRILSPLAGSDFTYASLERGKESAPGQVTVEELRNIYEAIGLR